MARRRFRPWVAWGGVAAIRELHSLLRWYRINSGRRRVLAGRDRWRRIRLRGRHLLWVDGGNVPERTHCGHSANERWAWLLVGGLRRWHLLVRGRRLPRLHGRAPTGALDRWHCHQPLMD